MIPLKGDKGMNISKEGLENLKNFLNDNLHHTSFSDGSGKVIRIDSLHEVILKGELRYYGIMGKFKDYHGLHNRTGDFYGEGFEKGEYPGSININKDCVNIFLRNYKLEQIKERNNV